jgi:hypothetical protein
MKKRLPYILVTLFPLVLLTIGFVHFLRPRGFDISNIKSHFTHNPQWEISDLPPDEIYSQEYHYLKGGCQCFTFVSEDQKYVIKFFKKKSRKHDLEFEQAFNSHKIAFDKLKDECGLIYIHLNKTNHLKKSITFIDKNAKKHKIDMDSVPFIVQKKAELLLSRMACTTKKEDTIAAFLNFIDHRSKKGFIDLDKDISKNYGFIGDQPIQIDVGSLIYDPEIKLDSNAEKELLRVRGKLQDLIP